MDPHGALFFYLCLLAAQVVLVETLSDLLVLMKRLEQPVGRGLSSRARHIHSLEQKLLNASFGGHNLTLQTNSIQSLVFKLSCDFPGLSLSSTTLTNVSQVRAPHAMQFPAELTKGACVTSRPAELRLICIYFFTAHLFQDDRNSSLLNNYVLGAQLDHRPVNNLQKPVNISFWHNRSLEGYTVSCVFWKEGASKSSWGAWSPEGCYTEQPSATQVLCHCNHLTYFAVLMHLHRGLAAHHTAVRSVQEAKRFHHTYPHEPEWLCSAPERHLPSELPDDPAHHAQARLQGAGCCPTLRTAQQPYLDGHRRLQPLPFPGACLQRLHSPILAQALHAGLGVSSPLGAAASDDQELSVWTLCDLTLQKPGKWHRLPECVHVLDPKSHGTQHPGHGLWWLHISVQPGGAGLGSVDLVQASGTGEGTESLGLPGHCHGVGSHCAAWHHLDPSLLLLRCVPAASALPLYHLQLALWFLPLPVVLLTKALLGCRSQGGDGGSQLLPDDTLTQLPPCSLCPHYFQQPMVLAPPGKVVGWRRDNRVYCTLQGSFPSLRITWDGRQRVALHPGPSCLDAAPLARLWTEN